VGESDFEILGRNPTETFIEAVSGIFQSLGRAPICLDPELRVVHASEGLDQLSAPGSAEAVVGLRAERILGTDLLGEEGSLRRALHVASHRRDRAFVAVCKGQTIHPQDLPEEVREGRAPVVPGAVSSGATTQAPSLEAPAASESASPSDERERLRTALDAHRWNRAETARALGVSRTTLWRRMRELGLGR
jgi:transcriptional regulator of acetoin/glycerol metabolism